MHERRRKLDWLREEGNNNEHRLLTNAKVLTEGIDVPALDAVVFFDSRESVVDIVQAVGRVMRKAPNKRYGYIIIPVVIKHGENNVAEELEESSYRTLWQVLSGLCSVDTSLLRDYVCSSSVSLIPSTLLAPNTPVITIITLNHSAINIPSCSILKTKS